MFQEPLPPHGDSWAAAAAAVHNSMAEEYDDLLSPWYSWLFVRMHEFLLQHLPSPEGVAISYDIGCGTGAQTFLLARAGYRVTGIDVAADLVAVARGKLTQGVLCADHPWPAFRSPFGYAARHHRWAETRLRRLRRDRPIQPPELLVGDVLNAQFPPGSADVVNCCGSVLSFIHDYQRALRLMVSWLKPGGLLILEAEQRWNLDLLWPFVDLLLQGRLGYEQTFSEAWSTMTAPMDRAVAIRYPFEFVTGQTLPMQLWLFGSGEITRLLNRTGCTCLSHQGIHVLTNLFPSTVLHSAQPSAWQSSVFGLLSSAERMIADLPLMRSLGCSVIMQFRKRNFSK